LDGHSATRITFHQVSIKKGDMLKIVGQANGVEPAPLDYVALLPAGMID
jgi:alpha-glucuronidase